MAIGLVLLHCYLTGSICAPMVIRSGTDTKVYRGGTNVWESSNIYTQGTYGFRHIFTLASSIVSLISSAIVEVMVDDNFSAYFNGNFIGSGGYAEYHTMDIKAMIVGASSEKYQENTLWIDVQNVGVEGWLSYSITIHFI